MSKKEPKPTILEKTQDWLSRHGDLAVGPLKAALAAAEARTEDTLEAARKLGEALEAREAAYEALKLALKQAKAAKKAPAVKKAPAPKVPATRTDAAPAVGTKAQGKAAPAKKAAPKAAAKKSPPPQA